MNRIAAIKKLQQIANMLDEKGLTAEASIIDSVAMRIAGIHDEGGLQGDYPLAPGISEQLGDYDPYSLSDLANKHVQDNPNWNRAEDMIEAQPDPSFGEEGIFEDEPEMSNDEKEMRNLALRWSSGQDSGLYGYAYTGMVYAIDQQQELLKEIDDAISFNSDPEEHLALQSLRMHVIDSVPLIAGGGLDTVDDVEIEQDIDPASGVDGITMTFETKNNALGVVSLARINGKLNFISAWLEVGGPEPMKLNWDVNTGLQFAQALYNKYVSRTRI